MSTGFTIEKESWAELVDKEISQVFSRQSDSTTDYKANMLKIGNLLVYIFAVYAVLYYYDEFYYIWVPLYTLPGLTCAVFLHDFDTVKRFPLESLFLAVLTILQCVSYLIFQNLRNPYQYESDRKICELAFTFLWMSILKRVTKWWHTVVAMWVITMISIRIYTMYYLLENSSRSSPEKKGSDF